MNKPQLELISTTTAETIDELPPIATLACEQCGSGFEPRHSGGKPQRFCSDDCRRGWHNAQRLKSPTSQDEEPNVSPTFQPTPQQEGPSVPKVASPAPPPQPSPSSGSYTFDWSALEEGDLVAPTQLAIAVYVNARGEVVIRQQQDWNEDEDHITLINRAFLLPLIHRLQEIDQKLARGDYDDE